MKSAPFNFAQAFGSEAQARRGKRRGFTLVELLVVISIIAILSVIGITVFSGVQRSARDAKRKGDIDAISKALEIYKSTNGSYPNLSAWSDQTTSWPSFTSAISPFMVSVPQDPSIGGTCCGVGWYIYGYIGLNGGAGFRLCTNLENNSDPARNMDAPENAITSNPPRISCDSGAETGNKWADYQRLSSQ